MFRNQLDNLLSRCAKNAGPIYNADWASHTGLGRVLILTYLANKFWTTVKPEFSEILQGYVIEIEKHEIFNHTGLTEAQERLAWRFLEQDGIIAREKSDKKDSRRVAFFPDKVAATINGSGATW